MNTDTRRILLFICLLAAALLLYPGTLVLTKPWKFGLALCDGYSSGKAWVDRNGNGHREPDEPGLAEVCIWDSFGPRMRNQEQVSEICGMSRTDENGYWDGGFKPGASCDEIYIYAVPPEGYRATTPLVVNDCLGEFGFVPSQSSGDGEEEKYRQYRTAVAKATWRKVLKSTARVLVIVGEVVLAAVVSGRAVRYSDERRGAEGRPCS
jgi:hypothetical protein